MPNESIENAMRNPNAAIDAAESAVAVRIEETEHTRHAASGAAEQERVAFDVFKRHFRFVDRMYVERQPMLPRKARAIGCEAGASGDIAVGAA